MQEVIDHLRSFQETTLCAFRELGGRLGEQISELSVASLLALGL